MSDNVVKFVPQQEGVPEFITRHDISLMNDQQLDTMIAAIRTRRMRSYVIFEQTKREKEQLEQDKVRVRIDKKCEMVIKKLNTIDKHMDDLEKYVNEIRGLRIQAGMEVL